MLVPGDPERQHMAKVDTDGGIRYHNNQINSLVIQFDLLIIIY